MRIVQVIHSFLPYATAGSELNAFYLSKELSKKYTIYVFHRVANSKIEEYEVCSKFFEGLNVCEINNTWKNCDSFELTYKNDTIASRFGDFIDKVKPDIMHFHHLTCLSTTLIQEAKKRDISIVFTLHDYWLICQRGQLLRKDLAICNIPHKVECVRCMFYQLNIKGWIRRGFPIAERAMSSLHGGHSVAKRLLRSGYLICTKPFLLLQRGAINQIKERTDHIKNMCSLVDRFISPSKFLKNKFREFGISEDKITYCEHGINMNIFRNFTKKQSKNIRFGYLGTITPPKGIHVLINAFNRVKDDDVSLKIYGPVISYDGFEDYFQRLQGMVSNPNVRFMGGYDNKDLLRILAEIDVLICPSIWHETSSLTIKEAFATKTPVIASKVGGITELVENNKNGLLFQVGDHRDLYKKINKFIEEPSLIIKFSKNISTAKTIEKNAEEIEDIYLSLIKKRKLRVEVLT